jgi:hypothetical protein
MPDPHRRIGDRLSFYDLIEAQIVQALRSVRGMSPSAIRRWIDTARMELGGHRSLLDDTGRRHSSMPSWPPRCDTP